MLDLVNGLSSPMFTAMLLASLLYTSFHIYRWRNDANLKRREKFLLCLSLIVSALCAILLLQRAEFFLWASNFWANSKITRVVIYIVGGIIGWLLAVLLVGLAAYIVDRKYRQAIPTIDFPKYYMDDLTTSYFILTDGLSKYLFCLIAMALIRTTILVLILWPISSFTGHSTPFAFLLIYLQLELYIFSGKWSDCKSVFKPLNKRIE